MYVHLVYIPKHTSKTGVNTIFLQSEEPSLELE